MTSIKPDGSTIEIIENRIESLKTMVEKSSHALDEYTNGMFGLPDEAMAKSPNETGIVENAPVVDKINFTLDEAFSAMYNIESRLDTLTSTIPSRITGSIQAQKCTNYE